MKCNLYLLRCDFGDDTLYKIGFTKRSVESRLKELRTGNANEIKIIHIFTSKWSIKIESIMHKLHGSKRINGEWFSLNSEDVKNFMDNCQMHHDNLELLSASNTYFMERNN